MTARRRNGRTLGADLPMKTMESRRLRGGRKRGRIGSRRKIRSVPFDLPRVPSALRPLSVIGSTPGGLDVTGAAARWGMTRRERNVAIGVGLAALLVVAELVIDFA